MDKKESDKTAIHTPEPPQAMYPGKPQVAEKQKGTREPKAEPKKKKTGTGRGNG